jgi:small subunit ribosomal protein S8
MTMDRISNMLSALKNATMVKNRAVEMVHTKECEAVAKVLLEKGYLSDVKTFKPKDKSYKMLNLELSKDENSFNINDIKRVSKPGRRVYKKSSEIQLSKEGFGVYVISTSRGVMDGETAKKKKLGGELICEVY